MSVDESEAIPERGVGMLTVACSVVIGGNVSCCCCNCYGAAISADSRGTRPPPTGPLLLYF